MLTTEPTLAPAQKQELKAAILADPTASAALSAGDLSGVADWCNTVASPAFWVWRTNVTRAEIYHTTSPDDTTWNWSTYKGQSVPEQGAWVQMFMGDEADFSRPNLRAGVSAIFTGSAPQVAQATHVLAMGRRPATRAEKALAAGTGSAVAPATMTWQGDVPYTEFTDPFYYQ